MVDPFGLIYAVLRFPESGRRDWEADQEKARVIAAASPGSGVLQGKTCVLVYPFDILLAARHCLGSLRVLSEMG